MSERRFSKSYLLAELEKQMAALQEKYGFDPSSGWRQVWNQPPHTAIEYGRYSMLQDIIDLELT